MAKRKRPSRPPRRRVAVSPLSAPAPAPVVDDGEVPPLSAPAPAPVVDDGDVPPVKQPSDTDDAVGDATQAPGDDTEMMVVQSGAETVTPCDKDDPTTTQPEGEESGKGGEEDIPPKVSLQVIPHQRIDVSSDVSHHSAVGLSADHPASTELAKPSHADQPASTEQPYAEQKHPGATSEADKRPDEPTCSEATSGDLRRPPLQWNPASDKDAKSGSKEATKTKDEDDEGSTKTMRLPPEDASTQTDEPMEGSADVHPAGSTQPAVRTQDQLVTSSDQTDGKESSSTVMAMLQAGQQQQRLQGPASQLSARLAALGQGPLDASAITVAPQRPKRPSSGDVEGRVSPDNKRRGLIDLPYMSRPRHEWGTASTAESLRMMNEALERSDRLREQQQQSRERRQTLEDMRYYLDASEHRNENENRSSSDRPAFVRYPNGLVVPQPPPPPRRSSPQGGDRTSVSPPGKQPPPRVRTAEEYVTLEEDEDPMADAIKMMKARGEFPCRMCDGSFRNLRTMKGHVKDHFGKKPPYHCNVCTLFYPDKAALGRHMKIHTGERPYECRRCNFAFTTKANCERHMKNRHQLTREELAENMTVQPSDTRVKPRTPPPPPPPPLLRPVMSLGGDLTVCTVCDASFGEYTPAVQHVKKFHPTKDQAQVLSTRGGLISAAPGLVEASQRPPLPLALPPLLPLPLPEGPLSTLSRSSTPRSAPRPVSPLQLTGDDPAPLDLSRKSARSETAPEMTPLTLPSAEDALRSAALMQMPYCMPFPMQLFLPSMQNMQMMSQQMEEMLAQTRSAGLGSGGGILTPVQMQAALQSAFNVGALGTVPLTPAPAENDREPEDDFALNLTPASASSASGPCGPIDDPRKKQKQRRYRTARPFQCGHCEARFTLSTNMDRHVKNTHPDKWEPKSRIARRSATAVSPEASPAEPPSANEPAPSGGAAATLVCVESDDEGGLVIDEPSRDEPDLASVDRLVVSAQAQTFQQYFRDDEERSSEDSERGASASPLGDEDAERADKRRSAYSNAPHKIPCRYCDRVFPWSSSLKRHELTHSGEKPYSCPHCPVHFTTKSNCDRHLVRKHSGSSGGEEGGAAPRAMERPFKCALCPSSTFSTQENLARHHVQKHAQGAAGPATHQFWCHVCDRRFFELERARDHVEADHEQSWARLERSSSRWVSQIAEDDQGQDQIFCLVCLSGFADTSELRRHMCSEHQSEDASSEDASSEDAASEDARSEDAACTEVPPPCRSQPAGPPRKRPTLEDISARLLAGSRLRAANSSPAPEEETSAQLKRETPMECDGPLQEGKGDGPRQEGKGDGQQREGEGGGPQREGEGAEGTPSAAQESGL